MSLINDVLRNLEANRPDYLAGQRLQREIRTLPAARPPHPGRSLALLGLLLLAVGAAAWQWHDRLDKPLVANAPLSPPTPQPVPVAVALPPVAVPLDNLTLAQELLSLPLAPPEPLSTVATAVVRNPAMPVAPDPAQPGVVAPATAAAVLPQGPAMLAVPPLPAKAEVPLAPVKIEKNPVLATARDRADVDWRRAETAFAAGRAEDGREALRSALRQDPGHLRVRQALLRQLLAEHRLDEAVVVLQEGINLQPAQAGWAMSLARLQLEQGDAAAADRTLARSQGFAENSADYAGFQGLIKSRLGAHRQAAAHYQRAARLAPGDGRWWLGLGLALESDNRLPESREALSQALALPNLPSELAAVAEQHLR